MSVEAPPSRVRLLEVDPDLGRYLTSDELLEARQLVVHVLTFGRDKETPVRDRLVEREAFAAIVLDGLVLEQIQIGEHVGVRLLGPGDLISVDDGPPSMLVTQSSARAIAGTRLALLGRELLAANRRWPGLTLGLHLRYAQQAERLTTHLVVCQLPRVDQRLLALMWLLAESWGRVTPSGTTLPMKLTHDILGALIGARRPTVTLALRELTDRGALVRQDQGWLLLEPPTEDARSLEALRSPSLIADPIDVRHGNGMASRAAEAQAAAAAAVSFGLLRDRLAELRVRHAAAKVTFDERLRELAQTRSRCQESRTRVTRDRLRRRRLRSS